MPSTIAKAYVQIMPTTKGIQSNIASELDGEMSSAGESSGSAFGSNLVSKIKSIIVTAGLGQALTESLNAGAALQQSLGGVETLFKDSADTVIANAQNAYKTAGMSANEYMETVTSFSASLLQGLSGDTAAAAEVADMALTDMSDNANKFGTDMESIQNAYQGFAKQNYTMLDNLKLGYGGTKEEMQRLLADAQKLSGVEYNIDNLADVYEAIHVIQDELGVTGTTATESASTFSGSMASMKAAATNLLGNLSLGEDIKPALNALAETVYTFVVGNLLPMVGNVLSGLPEILRNAMSIAIRGLNLIADNADSILQMGIDLITGIGSAIITALPYLAEAAWNIVTSLGSAIINTDWVQIGTDTINALRDSLDIAAGEILGTDGNIIESVLTAITNGLPSILEGGVEIISNLANGLMENTPVAIESMGMILESLLQTIVDIIPVILENGYTLIDNLASGMMGNAPAANESLSSVLNNLLTIITEALPGLIEMGVGIIFNLAMGILENLPVAIESMGMILESLLQTIVDMLPTILASGIDLILNLAMGILENLPAATDSMGKILTSILEAVIAVAPSILSNGFTLIQNLATGLLNNLPSVVSSISNIISRILSMLVSALPSLLQSGISLIGRLASGLLNNLPSVISSISSILAQLIAKIAQYLPNLLQSGISLIGKMAAGLIQAIPQVIASIPQIISSIVNSFSGYSWSSIGSNVISGIARGIRNGVSSIISAAKSAAASALYAAKKALGIASPSKVMRDEVGKFIPAGIATGIEKNTAPITGAIDELSDMTTKSLQANLQMDGFSASASVSNKSYGNNSFVINVYGAEGQDVEELAKILMEKIQLAVERRAVALA